MRGAERRVVAAEELLQLREVAGGEQRELLADDAERNREAGRRFGQGGELQLEALRGRAGADAGRVEVLEMLERDRELVGLDRELLGEHRRDLFQRLREVAVFVEGVDEQGDQLPIPVGQRRQRQLLQEVIAERGRFGRELGVVGVVGVVAGGTRAAGFEVPVGVLAARLVVGRRRVRFLGRLGLLDGRRRGPIQSSRRRRLLFALVALEQRILGEEALELLVQLESRELEEPDRLLQLWRQREVLRQLELQGLFHAGRGGVGRARTLLWSGARCYARGSYRPRRPGSGAPALLEAEVLA